MGSSYLRLLTQWIPHKLLNLIVTLRQRQMAQYQDSKSQILSSFLSLYYLLLMSLRWWTFKSSRYQVKRSLQSRSRLSLRARTKRLTLSVQALQAEALDLRVNNKRFSLLKLKIKQSFLSSETFINLYRSRSRPSSNHLLECLTHLYTTLAFFPFKSS